MRFRIRPKSDTFLLRAEPPAFLLYPHPRPFIGNRFVAFAVSDLFSARALPIEIASKARHRAVEPISTPRIEWFALLYTFYPAYAVAACVLSCDLCRPQRASASLLAVHRLKS